MKSIISFVFVFLISFFLSIGECLADEIGSKLNNNNLPIDSKSRNVKSEKNVEIDIPKASNDDIFGDEQSFPFIAGLGKNAAH